jgi:meiotically up-regulated gene 157 (Mug157) protein
MEYKNSEALHTLAQRVREAFPGDERLHQLFDNCFFDALDNAAKRQADGRVYVMTGDIPAMWLRDSAAQMRPYLMAAREDEAIAEVIAGVVRQQFFYINIDPYANAFNETPCGGIWQNDHTEMGPWLWERKYEIDSLCYPIQLAYLLYKNAGYSGHIDEAFFRGVQRIIDLWRVEQHHEARSSYRFERENCPPTDTLVRDGKGAPVQDGCGLIWSGFRPSDDACTYGYLIPSNMFAVVELGHIVTLANAFGKPEIAAQAQALREEVRQGIETVAVTDHPELGRVYAYETDGLGHYLLMDDANVPNLLSMSYLGYEPEDPLVAENTRKLILSRYNPCYYEGTVACGMGSVHTPKDYIWHIALALQGMTEPSRARKLELLDMIKRTAENGVMHEGFHKDDSRRYTREWFSWANAMFCELVLQLSGVSVEK